MSQEATNHRGHAQLNLIINTVTEASVTCKDDESIEAGEYERKLAQIQEAIVSNQAAGIPRMLLKWNLMPPLNVLQRELAWAVQAGSYTSPEQDILYATTLITVMIHDAGPTEPEASIDDETVRTVFAGAPPRSAPPPPPSGSSPPARHCSGARAAV